jgi:putative membrane protein
MPSVGPLEILVVIAIAAFWLAIIGLLAYAAVTLGRRRRATAGPVGPDLEDPAMADLRARFARGEIDEAEYQNRRAILQGR